MTEYNFEDLIFSFYGAAHDPNLWTESLQKLSDALGADEAVLIMWARNSQALVRSAQRVYAADTIQAYQEHYGFLDPARLYVDRAKEGAVYRCVECVPADSVERSEYYQDFLIPSGGRWVVGGKLCATDHLVASLGVHRGVRREAFDTLSAERMRALVPHLRQAAILHIRMLELRARAAQADAILDAATAPMLVADGAGRILRANAAAEALLDADDGLLARNEHLTAAVPVEAERLRNAVASAVVQSSGGSVSAAGHGLLTQGLTIRRGEGRRPLVARVVPLPVAPGQRFGVGCPAALIIVTDPDRVPVPRERLLQEAYHLSPAEARVAAHLARGMEPKQIADTLGVGITTVRSQITAILWKTGTSRQTELISLLTRLGS